MNKKKKGFMSMIGMIWVRVKKKGYRLFDKNEL